MGGGFRFLQTVIEATFIKVAKKRIARSGRIRPLSPSPKCHHRAFGCLFPPSVCWVLGPPFPFVPPPPAAYLLALLCHSDSPSVSPPSRPFVIREEGGIQREKNVKTPFIDTFSLTPPPPPPPPSPSRSTSSSSSSSPVFKKGAQEKKRNVGNVARTTLESCACLVPFYRYCLWPPPRPRPRRLPPQRRKSFCGLWRRRRRCCRCRCCRRRCLPGSDCRRCRRVRRPRGRPRCEVTGKRIKIV